MEKSKADATNITASLRKLDLNLKTSHFTGVVSTVQSSGLPFEKKKLPTLVSLCIGIIGKHLEDIVPDLGEIAAGFPADIKMTMAAIARRRKLLNDDIIISLADDAWEILDISGSEVSDNGLKKVAKMCKNLRAVDISRCSNITTVGVFKLVKHCQSLEILRCGGWPKTVSDRTARGCLGILKPKLNDVEGDSWEEVDTTEIAQGAQLRWLVWPEIDENSLEILSTECPRIIVNPKPSPFGLRGTEVPIEALPNISLDEPFIKHIDPKTWAAHGFLPRVTSPPVSSLCELSVAEKFRLAFVERDTRLGPKRAKNARQHQRRAGKEWVMNNTEAKAVALATRASKSLHSRSKVFL